MTNKVSITAGYVPTDSGSWVSENFIRLNEVVKDYDPNLAVGELPSELRVSQFLQENFFMVFDYSRNAPVFYFKPTEPPARILARIFRMDTRKNDVLKNLEDEEQAAEILRLKSLMDEESDRKDLAATVLKSNKNYIKFKPPGADKAVKFDDQLNRI